MESGAEIEMINAGADKIVSAAKSVKKLSFRLTERDVDILGFLLDQKFGSLEQIYFRFFDARKNVSDPLPQGLQVTRQRLSLLRQAGLVSTVRVYSEAKSLYLLTSQGYQVFQGKRPLDAFTTPMKTVDFRNFEHDTKVNDCRIAIERTGKIMKWLPERRLRMKGFESEYSWSSLPKEIVPDGIFISSKGERIAFEIETSPRAKRRYESKRDEFLSVMVGQQPLIHRVFWVGSVDRIMSDLRETVGNRKEFVVESYGHFLSKLWPKGMPERIGS